MINSITLAGRAGKDFTLKPIGTTLTKAVGTIAYQNRKDSPVSWFNVDIVSFGADPTARKASEQIKKGDLVLVEGKMLSNQAEDGKIYWRLEAHSFNLLNKEQA